jgi:hypothetical protein
VPETISINRAPVLTLWATVVAERLGLDRDEALSLGKAVAGLNAQSKGQSLGIYHKSGKPGKPEARPRGSFSVPLMGREVPAMKTADGVRAVTKGAPVSPESAQKYLESKLGPDLAAARRAMEELAKSFDPAVLAERAFGLYEKFRPAIPAGVRGWGAKGTLDLDLVRSLTTAARRKMEKEGRKQ